MLLTIIAFIFILGLLIFVHEFGHFITAKRFGVRVEEFGFGYPPRLLGRKWRGTIYSLNLIPFGGFVKIYGEDGKYKEDKKSFVSRKVWQRCLMLVAGVVMNFLLAALALGFGHGLGLPTVIKDGGDAKIKDAHVQIIQVAPDSPAQKAGLLAGDSILELGFGKLRNGGCDKCGTAAVQDSIKPQSVDEVQQFIKKYQGQKIDVVLERGREISEASLTPRVNPPPGEGAIGVALAKTGILAYPWHLAFLKGFESAFYLAVAIVSAIASLLWQLISAGRVAGDSFGGPIAIYMLTDQMRHLGFIYLLQFTAILSINLAIINVLPFPALDGGRLLFLLIEKIKGKPVNAKTERLIHNIGFALLIVLMLAITWRDIVRWF